MFKIKRYFLTFNREICTLCSEASSVNLDYNIITLIIVDFIEKKIRLY